VSAAEISGGNLEPAIVAFPTSRTFERFSDTGAEVEVAKVKESNKVL
jgi:hypothetical protein